MVEAGRHLNIQLITYADILGIEGEPGHFKVKIRKRAKSVDESLCTGCGACWNNCPVTNVVVHPVRDQGSHGVNIQKEEREK